MLCLMVLWKRTQSCGTTEMFRLKLLTSTASIRLLPTMMEPELGW